MPDAYLEAMMRGELGPGRAQKPPKQTPKSRFDLEMEKQIEAHLEKHSEDFASGCNNFMTPEMQRAKVKREMLEKAKLPELSAFLSQAFAFLHAEGKRYLESAAYQIMETDFKNARDILNKGDIAEIGSGNLEALLHIAPETRDAIFHVAIATFDEEVYPESLALFVALLTLFPHNGDYWYRAGIVAQKCKNFKLALDLYASAFALFPELTGAQIFSIECYLKEGMKSEARTLCKQIGDVPVDSEWSELFTALKIAAEA